MRRLGISFFALFCSVLQAEEGASAAGVAYERAAFVLKVSQEQGEAIAELVTTLGTSSLISLGFKRSHLQSLGKKLKGIGSLNFLGYIFSQAGLKGHMAEIYKSSAKWDGFIKGFQKDFAKEADTAEFRKELPAFAAYVRANYAELSVNAQNKDAAAFVETLLK